MTIYENFFFYGYLFGMKTEEIKSRANDLISFLDLPSGHSKLKFLRCIIANDYDINIISEQVINSFNCWKGGGLRADPETSEGNS